MIAALSMLSSVLGSAATSQPAAVAGPGTVSALAADPHADFGSILSQVASGTITDLKSAEATSIAGMQGKASVSQVVQAVNTAQQSLQMATAVRDKVVSAYQEISRMSI